MGIGIGIASVVILAGFVALFILKRKRKKDQTLLGRSMDTRGIIWFLP